MFVSWADSGTTFPMYAIHPIPMAQDNYGWLIVWPAATFSEPRAIVVDPTQAEPVLAALAHHGAALQAIWATHHHRDHTGGIAGVLDACAGTPDVVAGALDVAACRIPKASVALTDGQLWSCAGLSMHALHVPGHTLGATAFYVPQCKAVFVGDTLFASGCGRMFEGDAAMMWRSMQKLRALPQDTAVYCGHEYTVKNLEFTLRLQPRNHEVRRALASALRLRAQGEPTVPTTLAQECAINVFLRAEDPELQRQLGTQDAVATFGALRSARDQF